MTIEYKTKGKVYKTLQEVKDAYFPNIPLDELEDMPQTTEECLEEVEKIRNFNILKTIH